MFLLPSLAASASSGKAVASYYLVFVEFLVVVIVIVFILFLVVFVLVIIVLEVVVVILVIIVVGEVILFGLDFLQLEFFGP